MSCYLRLVFILCAFIVGGVSAEEAAEPSSAEIEHYIDGMMAARLSRDGIPGATIAVVRGGQLAFAKGYGLAEVDSGKPVVANETLFRIGSVSKLFTWTAIMQLYEQGKLDLDSNIGSYLPEVDLPDEPGTEITLRHLMSHTPGFEDGALGFLMASSPEELMPQREAVSRYRSYHNIVYKPGEVFAYSNYGVALAGQIVERVSGLSFDEYVERYIFSPLEMSRTTFREPLPDNLAPFMSDGHVKKHGQYHAKGFEYIHSFGPAGSVSATATDMAKFMSAHLDGGKHKAKVILSEKTTKKMHGTLLTADPRMSGMAHGFIQGRVRGHKTLEHSGGTLWFSSLLVLVPDLNVGVFVSLNAVDKYSLRQDIASAIVSQWAKGSVGEEAGLKLGANKSVHGFGHFSGVYRNARHSHTRLEKVTILGSDVTVRIENSGDLLLEQKGELSRWQYVEDELFEAVGRDRKLMFKVGDNGLATQLVIEGPGMTSSFIPLSLLERSEFFLWGNGAVFLLFLVMLFASISRRSFRSFSTKKSQSIFVFHCSLCLVYLLVFGVALAVLGSYDNSIVYRYPTSIVQAWSWSAIFVLLASVVTLPTFVKCLLHSGSSTANKSLHFCVIALTAVMLLLMQEWNVIGLKY